MDVHPAGPAAVQLVLQGCAAASRHPLRRLPGTSGEPDNDAIIVVKIGEFIGAHVYLCHTCCAIDTSASHPVRRSQ